MGLGTSVTSRWTSNPPISPRCTWTIRSASKPRNRCLPADSAISSVDPSSWVASRSNRPCGLLTRTRCPANTSVSSVARRCSVWPSGTSLLRGPATGGELGARRQRRQLSGLLVVAQHRDPARMALLFGERRREEQIDEVRHLVEGVHAAAHRDHVG